MKTNISYGTFVFDSASGYPVPNFSVSTSHERTAAGQYLSSEMVVTLEGIVYVQRMAEHYSPSMAGSDDISTLFAKASGLKTSIINNDRGLLSISCGNNKAVENSGLLRNISFDQNDNHWVRSINYKIEIAIPLTGIMDNGTTNNKHYHVSSVQDNYRVEVVEDQIYKVNDNLYLPTYRITRTLGATGKSISTSGAIFHAKQWVSERENTKPITSIFPPADFPLYNHNRSIAVNEPDGSYTISDTFIAKSGDPWIDTRNINLSIDSNGFHQIEINGKIQGLEKNVFNYVTTSNVSGKQDIVPTITGITQYKYQNAVSGYMSSITSMYNQAKQYKNLATNYSTDTKIPVNSFDLNPLPINITEGLNPTEGSISYTRTYNTRPLSLISGALLETINIRESNPTEAFSEIFVVGRRLGPVLISNTFNKGVGVKTVSYEGVFPGATGLKKYSFPHNIRQEINTFISGLKPTDKSIVKEDTETLNLTENRLSRTVSWEYTNC